MGIDETTDRDESREAISSPDEASDLRTTMKTKTAKTPKTTVSSRRTATDHHEPTTDDGATIENRVTQGPVTEPALRVKNEAAEARATGETRPRTQRKPLKKQPLKPQPKTLKTKTQQKKPKKKTKSQKSSQKYSSLSKSTWPA